MAKKILVVEENEGVRELVLENLKLLDLEAVVPPLSLSAVTEYFLKHRQDIVGVISDGIINPDISGVAVIKLIRSIDLEMPILALTANDLVAMDMMKVGATVFLLKPFSLETFRQTIRMLIDRR